MWGVGVPQVYVGASDVYIGKSTELLTLDFEFCFQKTQLKSKFILFKHLIILKYHLDKVHVEVWSS